MGGNFVIGTEEKGAQEEYHLKWGFMLINSHSGVSVYHWAQLHTRLRGEAQINHHYSRIIVEVLSSCVVDKGINVIIINK